MVEMSLKCINLRLYLNPPEDNELNDGPCFQIKVELLSEYWMH